MATDTSAEVQHAFDCNIGEDGLTEFDPEPQAHQDADRLWLRDDHPSAVDARPWEPFVARQQPRRWPVIAAGVLAVMTVVGGAVLWFGVRSRLATRPAATPAAAASSVQPVPVIPAARSTPAPAAAESVPAPVESAPAPVQPAPAVVRPAPPSTATAEPGVALPDAGRPAVDPALERTLARVSDAYRRRDAPSLAGVWPSADTASLSRAFANLKYQALSFDHCTLRPNGPTGALALCDVSLATAANDGDPALQRRHESWTLVLDRSAEPWTIAGVSVR